MNLKLNVVILAIAAVPVGAQAQAPRATTTDAQKVIEMISHNKAKTQAYCDVTKLGPQLEDAKAKNDTKKTNELSQKMVQLVTTLGPEYQALLTGYTPEIQAVLTEGVHKLCAK